MTRFRAAVVSASVGLLLLIAPGAGGQASLSYSFTPNAGPLGTVLRVTGAGCPPSGSGSDVTFTILNGPGRSASFASAPNGTFAFDYAVPPARAGEQSADSAYATSVFCVSNSQELEGAAFTITGPQYTLTPASGGAGTTVQFSGRGCFNATEPNDGRFLFSDSAPPVAFEAAEDFTFSGTFTVPADAAGDVTTKVTCLVQDRSSPSGPGGQELTGTAAFSVAAPATTTAPAAVAPANPKSASSSKGLSPAVLAALAVAVVAAVGGAVFGAMRLRSRSRTSSSHQSCHTRSDAALAATTRAERAPANAFGDDLRDVARAFDRALDALEQASVAFAPLRKESPPRAVKRVTPAEQRIASARRVLAGVPAAIDGAEQ